MVAPIIPVLGGAAGLGALAGFGFGSNDAGLVDTEIKKSNRTENVTDSRQFTTTNVTNDSRQFTLQEGDYNPIVQIDSPEATATQRNKKSQTPRQTQQAGAKTTPSLNPTTTAETTSKTTDTLRTLIIAAGVGVGAYTVLQFVD